MARVISTTTLLPASPELVLAVLTDRLGLGGPAGPLDPRDPVRLGPVTGIVLARDEQGWTLSGTGRHRGVRYRQWLRPTAAGTVVTDELLPQRRGGLGRWAARRLLRQRTQWVRAAVAARVQVVVGVALLDGARVLAARRADSGRWELPGGKVEPGESDPQALRRECQEELGVPVRLGERIGPDVPIHGPWVLRVFAGVADAPPRSLEHVELRWLEADQLSTVDWLPADVVLLPELRDRLKRTARSVDEDQ